MMKPDKYQTAIAVSVLLFFVIAVYFYPQMPAQIASHWNEKGQVDGYMSKFWGLFLLPIISLGITALLLAIPLIDPLRANIKEFKSYYYGFVLIFLFYLLYLYLLTILWNLGYSFNMVRYLAPGFGVLFYFIGVLVSKAKRNWSIGIRTPWTMSNEKVWEKTHKIGGRLFKIAGGVSLLGALFPDYALLFVLVPVIGVALFTVVYSFVIYQQVTK